MDYHKMMSAVKAGWARFMCLLAGFGGKSSKKSSKGGRSNGKKRLE